jgi:hypothetical protein
LTRHHVLHESDDDGEDSAAYAASNQLADNRADINAGKRRDQRLQDLAAADAADRAGDRATPKKAKSKVRRGGRFFLATGFGAGHSQIFKGATRARKSPVPAPADRHPSRGLRFRTLQDLEDVDSKNVELMPQHQDFGFQAPSRPEAVAEYADEQEADSIMRRA